MDDTRIPRPIGPLFVARLLLAASADPQLRLLFGFPPKDPVPHGLRHPQFLKLRRNDRAGADAKDSKSNVVPFPVVARPHPNRKRAAPKPPPKSP